MTAQLTGVTSAEVVTLHTQNINGDGQPHGDVPFGFLVGDADASRFGCQARSDARSRSIEPARDKRQLPRGSQRRRSNQEYGRSGNQG